MFNHKDQSFIGDRSSAGDVIILIPQTIERDMMPSKPVPDQQSKKGDQGYPVDDVIAITPQSNEFYFAHNEWVQKELDQIDEMMSNQHSKNWGQRYPAADGNSQNKWVQNTAVQIELVQNKSIQKELVQTDEVMPNQHSKNWGHIYLSTDGSTQNNWVQNTTMQNELVHNKSVHKGLVQNDEVMSIQQSKDWGQGYPTTDGSTPIEGVQNIAVQSELV
jgi:hypothetical protein